MRRRQSASTITTFALVVPVFLLIVFGTLELARVFSAWMVITSEAAEAARYGSVHYDATRDATLQANDVSAFIAQRLNGVLAPSGLVPAPVVRVTSDPKIDVIINYRVQLVIPLVSQFLPNPFPLQAHAIMRAEPGD